MARTSDPPSSSRRGLCSLGLRRSALSPAAGPTPPYAPSSRNARQPSRAPPSRSHAPSPDHASPVCDPLRPRAHHGRNLCHFPSWNGRRDSWSPSLNAPRLPCSFPCPSRQQKPNALLRPRSRSRSLCRRVSGAPDAPTTASHRGSFTRRPRSSPSSSSPTPSPLRTGIRVASSVVQRLHHRNSTAAPALSSISSHGEHAEPSLTRLR